MRPRGKTKGWELTFSVSLVPRIPMYIAGAVLEKHVFSRAYYTYALCTK